MVRASLAAAVGLLSLLLHSAPATAEVPPRLVTECTKSKIYFGESLTCHFVMMAEEEMVEVEVAKFPEFRGYWSENLALRQGPLPLVPDPRSSPLRRAVVGTYILTPMISDTPPTIEPMRVVVRRPLSFNAEEETTLNSEPAALEVKKLPSPPAGMAEAFRGAVGQFQFATEFTEIPYSKETPVSLRFFLHGEGNFHEINEPNITFPPEIEKVNVRNWSQGTPQFPSKVFEFTLLVRSESNLTLPAVDFVYFNPTTTRYERLQTPPIQFRYIPSQVTTEASVEKLPVRLNPQLSPPLTQQPAFWALQALGLLATLGVLMVRWKNRSRTETPSTTAVTVVDQRKNAKETLGQAKTALRQGDRSKFLSHSLTLLNQLQTHPEAGNSAELRSLRQLAERYLYSPDKTLPEDLQPFADELQRCTERFSG